MYENLKCLDVLKKTEEMKHILYLGLIGFAAFHLLLQFQQHSVNEVLVRRNLLNKIYDDFRPS